MTDFSYIKNGMFTAIFANTNQASEQLSAFMATNGGSNSILTIQLPQFSGWLKAAGYTISKSKEAKLSNAELDAMLAELAD